MKKFLWALVVGGLLSSCSTVNVTKSQRYPQVYAERPVSILVMPPINRSTKVDAKALFYSSLIVLLCVSAAADHGNPQGGKCL